MAEKTFKILIAGPPGCGKTRAIRDIVSWLPLCAISGFYTSAIREKGRHTGFAVTSIAGESSVFAHEDFETPSRVSKYGVDVEAFERIALPTIDLDKTAAPLLIIDEIGKMECLSQNFSRAVSRAFDSQRDVIATVAIKGTGLAEQVKHHPQAKLVDLGATSYEHAMEQIHRIVEATYGAEIA